MTPHAEEGVALSERVIASLSARGETLGFCESLTAGLAAATVACVPGASAVLRGGLVTYATEVKAHFLRVPVAQLNKQGVVSAATALAMSQAALTEISSDWALSLTGVAGPGLQEGKPAGTVFIGLAHYDRGTGRVDAHAFEKHFSGDRAQVRQGAVEECLRLLLEALAK
ncbi:CinA family protein [Corynebacterium flavescens]|uniref:Competence protein n=1 Tax=Corynebacterium flavescens TaxID=28028 RepID=A0A1L7CMJ3_CORFL|nr:MULTISPECIES: CinA family protein [Corynebacterium]APT87039.1 competence protein [Corynebacterium flavescens]KAA8721866.1 CinA family protein [Corynebacterium flavescens]MDN6098620.1 CinA family protein [Corynebacterium flavescens]MDN6198601.1 CinA family protein [Corynebacterium flavescens]MDN6225990.1 CinA family protein [Corynebacterium flavescens]